MLNRELRRKEQLEESTSCCVRAWFGTKRSEVQILSPRFPNSLGIIELAPTHHQHLHPKWEHLGTELLPFAPPPAAVPQPTDACRSSWSPRWHAPRGIGGRAAGPHCSHRRSKMCDEDCASQNE